MVSSIGAAATFNIFGVLTLLHLLIFWLINNYSTKYKTNRDDGDGGANSGKRTGDE